jgi:cysteine desulfurase
VAGIAGFAAALDVVRRDGAARAIALTGLRDELIARVLAAVPDAVLNGDPDRAGRLPGNAHVSFPGCEGDALLMLLDAQGVACSTGSACTAGVAKPSHVLLAMGQEAARARGSLRFSLGHTTEPEDIDELVAVLPGAVERARLAGAVRASR